MIIVDLRKELTSMSARAHAAEAHVIELKEKLRMLEEKFERAAVRPTASEITASHKKPALTK